MTIVTMFARIMTITYPVSIENIDGTTSSKALQSSLLTQFNTILYSISRVKDTNAKEQAAAHGALELCFTVIIQPITQNTALIIPNMIHIKFSSSRVDRHLTMPAPHRSVRAAFPHTALHNNIYSFRISWHISSALPVDNISAFLWTLPVYSSSCCSFGSEPWTAFLLPAVWSCLSSFRWSWHHNTCSALSVSDWAFPSVSLVSGLD